MKTFAVVLSVLLSSLAVVACGGGSSNGSSTESTSGGEGGAAGKEAEGGTAATGNTVQFEASPDGSLEFTSDQATAKAGKVTIDFTNTSGIPHDVVIEGSGGEKLAAVPQTPKGSESTTANLEPGTYTFYCSVPGHRQAGMEGTLTVK